MFSQSHHITAAIAQGWRPKLHHVQPVIKILTKIVFLDGLDNVAIGRSNNSDVDALFFIAAHSRERAVFKKTKQLGLQRPAHIADLIEKNGAAIRFLHTTGLSAQRPGKGTFLVTEQFTFQQVLRMAAQFRRM